MRPRGTVVRHPADWFSTLLAGGWANNGPCVGNRTGIGLYNDATDGSVIRVYGISVNVGTNGDLGLKSFQGTNGVRFTGEGAPAYIDPRQGTPWGQIWTQATASGVGKQVGGRVALMGFVYDWDEPYPLAIIPPGYTWSVETVSTNIQMYCAFRWLSIYE